MIGWGATLKGDDRVGFLNCLSGTFGSSSHVSYRLAELRMRR
jgi:hypothetical protein